MLSCAPVRRALFSGGRLELDYLVRFTVVLVDQPALHDGTELDLQRLVVDVSCDIRLGLQFHVLGGVHRPDHRAVDHDMRNADLALDLRLLGKHQPARPTLGGDHVAAHAALHVQAPRESHAALDRGAGAYQAVDILGRIVALRSEHGSTPSSVREASTDPTGGLSSCFAAVSQETVTVCDSLGATEPFSKTRI